MKTLTAAIVSATVLTSMTVGSAQASTRTALEQCKHAVKAQFDVPEDTYFYRYPAISTRGEKYTFWINSSAKMEDGKVAMKSRCETTEQGEVVSLRTSKGRWH